MPTEDAALLLRFSLVASGQIKLRRIDGWQNIDVVLNQHSPRDMMTRRVCPGLPQDRKLVGLEVPPGLSTHTDEVIDEA